MAKDDLPDAPWASPSPDSPPLPDAPWAPPPPAQSPDEGALWPSYAQFNREAREQMGTGIEQLKEGAKFAVTKTPEGMTGGERAAAGPLNIAKGLGNTALGALNYVASPVNAAIRDVIGNPIEKVTGIPKEYPEFAASLAIPGPKRIPPSTAPLTKTQEIAEASQRLGVPISRAAATENVPVQATAGALKEIPVVGTPLVKSSKQSLEAMDRAAGDTVAGYGSGQPLAAGQAASEGLEKWITGTSGDVANRLYKRVDALVDPLHTRELDATRNVVGDIMAKRANAKISGTSRAVDEVMEAVRTPGGLNYDGLKDLRTYIRDLTPEEMIAKGINKKEATRIYGALTEDLRATILDAGGPDAVTAFNRANRVYDVIADKRAALAKVIGVKADAAPEKVMGRIMAMAGSKQAADYQKLVQVRRAIGPDKWDEVTSAVVNGMGRDKPGSEFSGARFKTSWDALPDNSKRLLFNSTGKPELAKSVEDLMTLSDAHKQLMKYGNPSGTGRVGSLVGAAGALWASPLSAIEAAVGGYALARFLASPVTVKQAKTWTLAYTNAAQNPTPQRMALLTSQSDKLAREINRELGGNVSGMDFLRGTQGVGVGRTEENKNEVPRVPGKQHDSNEIGQQHGGAILGQGTSRETAFDIEKLTPKQRLLLPDGAFYRWKDPGNPGADKDGFVYRQRDHAKTAPTMPKDARSQ